MSNFKGPYRRKDFGLSERTRQGATYVTVYQRPDEEPLLDFNFMDGDHDIDKAKDMVGLLNEAIAQAEQWKSE